ncbi:Toxin co-regulated pilus biosynthesis protein Q [Shewanella psychrophila]|uniref:Toxin co-regulated pilus biosynthesis protein Q n=1 Tax=Shewanella psychrophila TaxID=225848 RepID=A0A1S6HWX7_9GAMM|nr:TcpQ domain-containing protein [Shewanella psychrophila]AQS39918.1 Toxin co-regulated pilus biosynthesis protein Q [Shewanella psychrophila]
MMKVKLILLIALSLSIVPETVLANDSDVVKSDDSSHIEAQISLVIKKGNSVESSLSDFVQRFGYKLKWDTEDITSGYSVSYEDTTAIGILKQFVSDMRANGKLIKGTIYKNKVLVIENESE